MPYTSSNYPSLPVLFNIGIPVAFSPNVINGNCEFIDINVTLGNALNVRVASLQDAKETECQRFFYRAIIPTEYGCRRTLFPTEYGFEKNVATLSKHLKGCPIYNQNKRLIIKNKI